MTDAERAELIAWHREQYELLLAEFDAAWNGKGGNTDDEEQERDA